MNIQQEENNHIERDLSLDILRILACLMVVGIHTVVEGWYATSPRTFTWGVLNFYDTLFRPAVPLFFMISGSLMLRKKRIDPKRLWTRNILRLLVIYYVWVLFYALTNDGVHKALKNPMETLKNVLGPNPQFHLWYLRKLIFIYAVSPLLWSLSRAMNNKMLRYYMILFFIFGVCMNTIYEMPFTPVWLHDQLSLFGGMDLMEYTAYFMFGYLLSSQDIMDRFSRKKLLLVYLLTTVLAAAVNHMVSWHDNWPTQMLYGNFALPVAVETFCLFLLARKTFQRKNISAKAVSRITLVSGSTLFVYLIHPFVIRRLQIYFGLYIMKYNVLFSVPLMLLLVFTVSSVCGMLLERIPGLNRIL